MAKFFTIFACLLLTCSISHATFSNSWYSSIADTPLSAPSPAPTLDCEPIIDNVMNCFPFLMSDDGSKPDEYCCSAIETAATTNIECLCEIIETDQIIGYVAKAMKIPSACGIKSPFGQCNMPTSHALAPESPVPSEAPMKGLSGSPTPSPNPGPIISPVFPPSLPKPSPAPSPSVPGPSKTPLAPSPSVPGPSETPLAPSPSVPGPSNTLVAPSPSVPSPRQGRSDTLVAPSPSMPSPKQEPSNTPATPSPSVPSPEQAPSNTPATPSPSVSSPEHGPSETPAASFPSVPGTEPGPAPKKALAAPTAYPISITVIAISGILFAYFS